MHPSRLVAAVLLACALIAVPSVAAEKRPNVVVILTDDQGTLDANCFGAEDLHTPNLDRLAREGVRFTQAYSHTVCCPARAALLTGRHPQRSGVNQWLQGNMHDALGRPRNMALSEVTLAEALKKAGYKTAIFGKWHLGAAKNSGPTEQGFDEFFGIRGGFIDNYRHHFLHGNGYHDLYDGTEEVFAEGKYFPDMVMQRALKFLDENHEQPFFLYLPLNTPHYPEQAPQRHLDRYAKLPQPRRTYAAFVTATDEWIGQVLDKLDQLGVADDTIVIFQSDNGHSAEDYQISVDDHSSGLPKGANYGANGGGGFTGKWTGQKGTFLEGGVRTPAIMRYAKAAPPGQVRDQVVTIMDWYPTVLKLCDIRPTAKLDGRSLTPILASPEADSQHPVLHFQWYNTWAVRQGDWKLVHQRGRGANSLGKSFLYRLSDEQPERKDYAQQEPELVQALTNLHEEWAADVFPDEE